jgi:hypothetical protein
MKLSNGCVSWVLGHVIVLTFVSSSLGWLLIGGLRGRMNLSAHPPAGGMRAEVSREVNLGPVRDTHVYAVTVSAKDPLQFQGQQAVRVRIADAEGVLAEKWLHTADLDFYVTIRPRSSGQVTFTLASPTGFLPEVVTSLRRIGGTSSSARRDHGVIAAQPNGTWRTAQPLEFGHSASGS